MSEPALLTCPACGAPTSFGAPFCTYCRRPLTWGAVPLLSRGRLVQRLDATHEAIDERELASIARTAEGTVATVGARKAANGAIGRPRRHGCIVVEAAALDAHTAIGVAGRQQESTASGGYSLAVAPYLRSVNLAKVVASGDQVYFQPLHAWEHRLCVRGVGEMNEVELRLADSIIQVFVNGDHVAACVDATFGFGAFCWRIQSLTGAPARACIRSVSVYDVA